MLWVSSLTDEAIGEGFRQLRPDSAFDDLGQAARARAQADSLPYLYPRYSIMIMIIFRLVVLSGSD